MLTLKTTAPIINPRPEGYGSRFVILSICLSVCLSICLSTALQRAALTFSCQLRYEQAKHVDGLQSDGWILLKCFRSRVMAGSPIVGCPDTYRFDPYCRTALGVQRDLMKSLSTLYQSLHRHLATCWHNGIHGHAKLFIQHLLVFWLINSERLY